MGILSLRLGAESGSAAVGVLEEPARAPAIEEAPPELAPAEASWRPPPRVPLAGCAASESDASVMVVDDEADVRDLLSTWLTTSGFSVVAVDRAEEALSRAGQRTPAVAVCDIHLPGADGFWLAGQLQQVCPETAVIVSTGHGDVAAMEKSWQQGATDFLLKPFSRERFAHAVRRGFEWHCQVAEARGWRRTLQHETEMRKGHLAEVLAARPPVSTDDLDALVVRLTNENRRDSWHAFRVSHYAVRLGQQLGMSRERLSVLEQAALLHDLGKLIVPHALLQKPASLTRGEQDIIRSHPLIADDLLRAVPTLREAATTVLAIREWFDGTGYPCGLAGEGIPLGSRIIAVVDAYDTMALPRPYRAAVTLADAVKELRRGRGTQFDPTIVDTFCRLVATMGHLG